MLNSTHIIASIIRRKVGGMLFALPVGGVNIWPIGRGIPWGNHGCLPVVTSWHKSMESAEQRDNLELKNENIVVN